MIIVYVVSGGAYENGSLLTKLVALLNRPDYRLLYHSKLKQVPESSTKFHKIGEGL
ncbi:hypothetical protein PILCRDRAFT_813285 [Piloderma croceum F 1598]|uniref:Uncharacterized protein n=1 Tax=Piloderma croceum (strain F 1598) TaxID=765440 RepID=A0A0C3GFC1_PILCF|nr:hypothetical protein PILCRDRAFT_813285 [Piloderma croceum F 1598]